MHSKNNQFQKNIFREKLFKIFVIFDYFNRTCHLKLIVAASYYSNIDQVFQRYMWGKNM